MVSSFSFILLVVIPFTVAQDWPPLDHKVVLEEFGSFELHWSTTDEYITFEMAAQNRGYMAIGFSPNGGMRGADIVIGWIDEKGEPYISDRYSNENSSPKVDDSQDVELIMGFRNATHSVLRFRRPWVTCDKAHDVPLTEDTTRLIFALHPDIPDPRNDVLPYHRIRGTKSIYLKEPNFEIPEVSNDLQYFDWIAPNISLPTNSDTLYWCKLFKIPKLEVKNHVVAYQPLIQNGHEAYVHHILIHECHLKNLSILEPWTNHKGAQCYSPNMPPSFYSCNVPLLGYGVGGEGMVRPPHVGTPIGEEFGGFTYVLMEIHYDNPMLTPGIYDNSGVRLFHTTKLRKFDTGHLTTGAIVHQNMMIGPGVTKWMSKFYCTPECLGSAIPATGIKIISGILHGHLSTKSVVIRLVRDGKELEPILRDRHYDFNYQQERILEKERLVLPGDTIITECEYDTSNQTTPVFGGFGTNEEMCFAFITYYPRAKLGSCLSRYTTRGLAKGLAVEVNGIEEIAKSEENARFFKSVREEGISSKVEKFFRGKNDVTGSKESILVARVDGLKRITVKEPTTSKNETLYDLLHNRSFWKDGENALLINKKLSDQEQIQLCMGYGRQAIVPKPTILSKPLNFIPYVEEENECN